uniref:GTP_EFTU_D3 domain-containing protein n=1 Tax=Caenorhabditis japonica TaxID=281687 RepID=A0A8R1EKN6_CAEJA
MTAKSTVSLATTFFSHFKALLSRNLCKLAPSSSEVGARAELYAHSVCVPCTFTKLTHTINKSNGEVLKQRPRFLAKGTSAVVEVETEHDIAVEPFTSCRPLGRVTFRSAGQTIAAGIVEAVITPQ